MNETFLVFNFVVGAWTCKNGEIKSTAQMSTVIGQESAEWKLHEIFILGP